MITNQIIDYIKQQTQAGKTKEEIETSLFNAGWRKTDINEAFKSIRPKKKLLKKIILIFIGSVIGLFLLILFLPNILSLFSKDIPPIDDSDLQLKKIEIPREQNAYYDLIKLGGDINEPKNIVHETTAVQDYINGKSWDDNLIENILSQNTEAFTYFTEATDKPKFQDPNFSDSAKIKPTVIVISLNSWRQASRLSVLKALFLLKQGKDKEAFDEVFKSIKIGQKIQESQCSVIEYLVGIGIKKIGLEALQKIIASSKLESNELKKYAETLNEFYKNEEGLISMWKEQYSEQIWAINSVVSGDKNILSEEDNFSSREIKNNFYFKPNKTKALFVEYTRENIKNAEKPCNLIEKREIKELAPESKIKMYVTENAVGKVITDIVAASLGSINDKKCQDDLLVAVAQLLFALKAYKNDTGNLPVSLINLVPQYISSVPSDPFDGKPIRYSSTKKILYSVGEDNIDSGGSTGESWSTMPDPTFKIDF